MNNTIKIKINLCPDYKVFCENCRYGENSTIEEYEEYLDDIVNAHIPFIDDVFVADEVCEHCGANTLHVIAKLKIETV